MSAGAFVTALQGCPHLTHLSLKHPVQLKGWTKEQREQLKTAAPKLQHLHLEQLGNNACAHAQRLGSPAGNSCAAGRR